MCAYCAYGGPLRVLSSAICFVINKDVVVDEYVRWIFFLYAAVFVCRFDGFSG